MTDLEDFSCGLVIPAHGATLGIISPSLRPLACSFLLSQYVSQN